VLEPPAARQAEPGLAGFLPSIPVQTDRLSLLRVGLGSVVRHDRRFPSVCVPRHDAVHDMIDVEICVVMNVGEYLWVLYHMIS